MKHIRCLILGNALIFGLTVSGVRAQPKLVDVNYGILNYTAAEWPLMLAQSQGFFTKEGVNVSLVSAGSPQLPSSNSLKARP